MYADILFLTEWIRDYLILYAVSKLVHRPVSARRLFCGAAAGAVFSTAAAFLLPADALFVNLLFGLFLCAVMLFTAFRPKTGTVFFHLLLCTYTVAFILGGIISAVNSRLPSVPPALLFFIAWLLLAAGFAILRRLKKRIRKYADVRIRISEQTKTLRALVDTGNLLKDPPSGLPVSIIHAQALPAPASAYDCHDVAFHSLGCENGTLKVMYVPFLYIEYRGSETLLQDAPVGISPYPLSPADAYQMIVSPEIFIKQTERKP